MPKVPIFSVYYICQKLKSFKLYDSDNKKIMKHIMYNQSHYREVPRWGVSNGARHNWKCFFAYKIFEKKYVLKIS